MLPQHYRYWPGLELNHQFHKLQVRQLPLLHQLRLRSRGGTLHFSES
jgi:hypothetical protein